jgi:hypothetical protein
MAKLNFEYDERRGEYRAEYRGLVIIADNDSHADNPFTAWDCEAPTLVIHGGRHARIDDYSGDSLDSPLDLIPDSKLRLRRYWEAAARAVDLCPAAFRSECEQEARDYGCSIVCTMREALESALGDMRPSFYSGNAGDYLQALESLWRLAGFAALYWSSQGYSQGDYAAGLSVATPDWIRKTGAPADSHMRQLESAGELWGAWAWGDVYSFTIETPAGEFLDSCAGFYGSDFDKSGLGEAARDSADYILAGAKKRRLAAAKAAIRNRVPLAYRPAMLAQAAELSAL